MDAFPEELLRRMQKGPVATTFGEPQIAQRIVGVGGETEASSSGSEEGAYRLRAPFGREKKVHCLQLALPRSCLSATAAAPRTWDLIFATEAEGGLRKHVEKKSMMAGLKAISAAKKAKTAR